MADSEPSTSTHTGDGSFAKPKDKVPTGRARINNIGARLAADYTIGMDTNEPDYPVTVHTLLPAVLQSLYYNILIQIVITISRDLGFQDPNTAAAGRALQRIAKNVAHAAVTATYAVLFNKARRHDAGYTRGLRTPAMAHDTFPIYITSLINSIGPIQLGDIPSRRLHIPLLDSSALNPPNNYRSTDIVLFKEKLLKSKILSANVEPLGSESSAWWMLYPVKTADSTLEDYGTKEFPNENSGNVVSSTPDVLPVLQVFSPVKYDFVENALKLGMVFARAPLCDPPIGPWSATRWYEREELTSFTGTTPTIVMFPAETRDYPYHWKSNTASYAFIESARFTINETETTRTVPYTGLIAPGEHPPAHEQQRVIRRRITRDTSATVTRVPVRVSARTPTVVSNDQEMESDNEITQYRIVYIYFDHIAIQMMQPYIYNGLAYELNSST